MLELALLSAQKLLRHSFQTWRKIILPFLLFRRKKLLLVYFCSADLSLKISRDTCHKLFNCTLSQEILFALPNAIDVHLYQGPNDQL